MRLGSRRWRRRAGRCLAAVAFVAAVGLTAMPVSASGTSTCGSVLVRQHPVGEDAEALQRIETRCDQAIARQGALALSIGGTSLAFAAGALWSKRRALRRYYLWRAGRIRAGLSVSPQPGLVAPLPTTGRPLATVHEFEPHDIWATRPSLPPAAMAD